MTADVGSEQDPRANAVVDQLRGLLGRFVAVCGDHPEILDVHESIRYVFGDALDLIALVAADAVERPATQPSATRQLTDDDLDAIEERGGWETFTAGDGLPGIRAATNDIVALVAELRSERSVAQDLAAALRLRLEHWHSRQGPPCDECDRVHNETLAALARFDGQVGQ